MAQVTVYTTPACSQCRMTKRWLDSKGIDYSTVDLSQSPDDLAAVKALGYEAAPVVIVSNGDPETDLHWYGFRPDHLTRYTSQEAA